METYLKAYNTESEYNASKSSFKNNTVSTHETEVEYDKFDIPYEVYKAGTSGATFSLGQWRVGQVFSTPKIGYFVFESNSNWHVPSSKSVIKVPFPKGMTSATVYYYSDGESNYDYTVLSRLDIDLSNRSETNSTYYVGTTKGNQKTWKSYTYTIPNDGQEHFFTACYVKDSTVNSFEDRGAIAINFGVTFSYYNNAEKYLGIRNGKDISSEDSPYVILNDRINYSKDKAFEGIRHISDDTYANTSSYQYSSWKLTKDFEASNRGYYRFHTMGTTGTMDATAFVDSRMYLEILVPKNFGEFKCFYNPPHTFFGNGEISIAHKSEKNRSLSFKDDEYIIKNISSTGEITISNFKEDTYLYIFADYSSITGGGSSYIKWSTPVAWVELPKELFEGISRKKGAENVLFHKLGPIETIRVQYSCAKVNVGGVSNLYALTNPVLWEKENLIWESSNPEIATVDSFGKVKGISKGTAVITVYSPDRSISANKTIEVIKITPWFSSSSIPCPTTAKVGDTTTVSLKQYIGDTDGYIKYVSIYNIDTNSYDDTYGDITFTKDTYSITWKKPGKLRVLVTLDISDQDLAYNEITINEN